MESKTKLNHYFLIQFVSKFTHLRPSCLQIVDYKIIHFNLTDEKNSQVVVNTWFKENRVNSSSSELITHSGQMMIIALMAKYLLVIELGSPCPQIEKHSLNCKGNKISNITLLNTDHSHIMETNCGRASIMI